MDNVAFATQGDYAFSIAIDSEQLERVEVHAELAGKGAGTMEANAPDEARALLREGYVAFGQGDAVLAEELFRKVADRFPMFPDGHNNLGFMLLAKGDAKAALEAFAKAKELHYSQPEIGNANLGCAMYMSGDAAGAQQLFTDCLRTQLLTTPATLFGIGPSGLFPVYLSSAADYATLMALNAAWSAQVAGDLLEVSHFLESARAGELSRRADATGKQFVESLSALEAKVGITP
jgi:tetratricopeptide (TPR) repeat protein